jgi:hypothetical protein
MSEHETIQVIITSTEYFLLGLTIVLGGFVTILIQATTKWWNNRQTRFDIVDGLYLELDNTRETISNEDLTTIEEQALLESVEGRTVKTNKTTIPIFTHSFFDSIVNSGQFVLLEKQLREDIATIYNMIGSSNFNAQLITKLTFIIKTDKTTLAEWKKTFDLQKLTFQDIHDDVMPLIKEVLIKLDKIHLHKKKKPKEENP